MRPTDDVVIVEQVLKGDESAFASLVDRYRDTIT